MRHRFSTLQLAWADGISPPVRLTPATRGRDVGPRSRMSRGSPTTNKHRPLWTSGSVDLKCLARWDVVIGIHAQLHYTLEYEIHPIIM
jgi:hypothetical protein